MSSLGLALVLVAALPAEPPAADGPPLTSTATAGLAPARTPRAAPTPSPRRWYGGQLLLADGVGYAIVGVSLALPSLELLAGGAVYLLFDSLVVHALHHQWSRGLLSVGATLGGGLLGGVLTCGLGGCRGEWGGLSGFLGGLIGAGVGRLTATILDASVLGWEEPAEGPALAFGLAPGPDGAGVIASVGGRF